MNQLKWMKAIKNIIKAVIPENIRTGFKQSIRRIRYKGNAHFCPICKSSIREFLELGYDLPVITENQIVGGGLRKALCPVCGSSDRTRLLHIFFQSQTSIYLGKIKVLHVAPEPALSRNFSKIKNLDYLTADLNPVNVMEQMDLTQIKYPENSFDMIIANHVMEHIPDDRKAMAEIFRVLRPGGMAVLQIPISKILKKTDEDFDIVDAGEREKFFGQTDHVRIYGQDYIDRLKAVGFFVDPYIWTLETELKSKGKNYGLNPEEVVFRCLKPE